jgi:release factor glutamine methyltransferase
MGTKIPAYTFAHMQLQDNKLSTFKAYFDKGMKTAGIEKGEWRPLFKMLCQEGLGLQAKDILLADSTRLTESEMLKGISIFKQLKAHRPIQYILGECDFMGLRFKIDERALIPRPETEELIDYILEEKKKPIKVMDLGTGSGCIAISLAHGLPESEVHALDLSEGALELARLNSERLEVNIQFYKDDLHLISGSYPTFDMVVSNPPYITEKEKVFMEPRVLDHEPSLALFVPDEQPLASYEGILDFCDAFLEVDGLLFLEINEALGEMTLELIENRGYQCDIPRKDIYGKDRFLRALKRS